MSVLELVRPRVRSVPEPFSSLGEEACAFARRIGMTLDPEQEMVLSESLGVREDGRWRTRECGLNVPRQNGKGEVLIARELFGLFELGERLIIHTAHEFKTSRRHFNRLESVVRANPELHAQVLRRDDTRRGEPGAIVGYRYSHGEEGIELQDGRTIEFRTRTKSGMRGFDGVELLVLDEAMILPEDGLNAALPIIRASPAARGAQVWFTGSAVDQEAHEHGLVWTRVRESGMGGQDPDLAYWEWSLDFEHPNDVPDEVTDDPEMWRQVNFAIERGRVTEDHMAWERKVLGDRGFKVELLGVGDYPSTDPTVGAVILIEEWDRLENRESRLQTPYCLGFDVSPERTTSIALGGYNQDGDFHTEIQEHKRGTGWVVDRIVEMVEKANGDIAVVVCDGTGPASSLLVPLAEAGVIVETVNATEHGQACGRLVDMVTDGTLAHLGSMELRDAVRGAKSRPLGDAWAWSRKNSSVDISPLVAVTLALGAAAGVSVGSPEMFVW